jgi:hypothetical protein
VPFTLRNIKEDLEDIGLRFDGAPDLEFRAATKALELEDSALSYQRVPPGRARRRGRRARARAASDDPGTETPVQKRSSLDQARHDGFSAWLTVDAT